MVNRGINIKGVFLLLFTKSGQGNLTLLSYLNIILSSGLHKQDMRSNLEIKCLSVSSVIQD